MTNRDASFPQVVDNRGADDTAGAGDEYGLLGQDSSVIRARICASALSSSSPIETNRGSRRSTVARSSRWTSSAAATVSRMILDRASSRSGPIFVGYQAGAAFLAEADRCGG